MLTTQLEHSLRLVFFPQKQKHYPTTMKAYQLNRKGKKRKTVHGPDLYQRNYTVTSCQDARTIKTKTAIFLFTWREHVPSTHNINISYQGWLKSQ